MKILSAFSSRDNLDDIVFNGRNKAYGAYAIRNEYSNQLTKALFVGVAFFASLSLVPLAISAFSTKEIVNSNTTPGDIILRNVETPEIQKAKPIAAVPDVKTVESPEYKPVKAVVKDKPLPTKDDFKDAAIGSETKSGEKTDLAVVPPYIPGPPSQNPVKETALPTVPAVDPNKILDPGSVDVSADFKGGINAFREKVAQNFDTETVDKTGVVSGVITFVVEKDGSISNLKVTGSNSDFNAEAERTVKSIKTKWTPAQLKGKAVRSSFRMPISMKIE